MQQSVPYRCCAEDLVRHVERDERRFGREGRRGDDGGCGFGIALCGRGGVLALIYLPSFPRSPHVFPRMSEDIHRH